MKKIFFCLVITNLTFITFISCNNENKEDEKNLTTISSTSSLDKLTGNYEIGNFKQKDKINISYENGQYTLKEFNKKINAFQKLATLKTIDGDDLKNFVGLPIYNQLIDKTALYTDYKGGIAVLKIKKDAEIRTMMSSGKSGSEYILYFGDSTVKEIFKK
jgi:hypothetical protein